MAAILRPIVIFGMSVSHFEPKPIELYNVGSAQKSSFYDLILAWLELCANIYDRNAKGYTDCPDQVAHISQDISSSDWKFFRAVNILTYPVEPITIIDA